MPGTGPPAAGVPIQAKISVEWPRYGSPARSTPSTAPGTMAAATGMDAREDADPLFSGGAGRHLRLLQRDPRLVQRHGRRRLGPAHRARQQLNLGVLRPKGLRFEHRHTGDPRVGPAQHEDRLDTRT